MQVTCDADKYSLPGAAATAGQAAGQTLHMRRVRGAGTGAGALPAASVPTAAPRPYSTVPSVMPHPWAVMTEFIWSAICARV